MKMTRILFLLLFALAIPAAIGDFQEAAAQGRTWGEDWDKLVSVEEARSAGPGHPWQGRIPGVNPFSLAKQTEIPLVAWRARGGLPVNFALYHNSQAVYSNPALGAKWTHSYDTHLDVWVEANGARKAALVWGNHTVQLFAQVGRQWVPLDGYRDRLESRGQRYIVTLKSREQLEFNPLFSDAPGRYLLTQISDPNGNALRLSYNRNGLLSQVSDPSGRSLQLSYSTAGDPPASTKLTDVRFLSRELSRTWKLAHRNNDLLLLVTPRIVIDDEPQTYQMQFGNDANGNIITLTDRAGQTWQYGYDGNRLAWEQWPGNRPEQRVLYSFQPGGVRKLTDPSGNTTIYTYDAASRLVSTQDATGAVRGLVYTDRNYDWAPSQVILPSNTSYRFDYDADGNITGLIDAAGNRTDLVWDSRNRLTQMLEPLIKGEATRHRTDYGYDARDNLIQIRRYTDASNFILTEYHYDKHGQVTRFINNLGKITHYSYDDHGNLTRVVTPMGRQTSWLYEDAEQTFGFTRPNAWLDGAGVRINLLYDEWGRLRVKDYPSGADTQYDYDGRNRLVRMLDATGVTLWEYNANGWVNRVMKDKDWSVDYEYYPNGLRARMTETSSRGSRILDYTYTPRNELHAIIERGLSIQFFYDADGRLIRRQLPTGARMERSYAEGRLAQVIHFDASNIPIASYSYSYQENGLPRQLVERNGSQATIMYNFFGRPVSEKGIIIGTNGVTRMYEYQWIYDELGNRRKQTVNETVTTYTYDDDNRLLSATPQGQGEVLYRWDANGRLVERQHQGVSNRFAYDFEGRLVSIFEQRGLDWQPVNGYQYDGLSRRVARTTFSRLGEMTSTYRYDGPSVMSEDRTDIRGNNSSALYTWGYGLISTRDESSNRSIWSATDGFGSLRGWTDDRGQVGQYAAIFNAFGEVVQEHGARPPYAFGADLGFRSDGEADLVYISSGRYYDAQIATCLVQDPPFDFGLDLDDTPPAPGPPQFDFGQDLESTPPAPGPPQFDFGQDLFGGRGGCAAPGHRGCKRCSDSAGGNNMQYGFGDLWKDFGPVISPLFWWISGGK
jgi:YD repeat-containing protein